MIETWTYRFVRTKFYGNDADFIRCYFGKILMNNIEEIMKQDPCESSYDEIFITECTKELLQHPFLIKFEKKESFDLYFVIGKNSNGIFHHPIYYDQTLDRCLEVVKKDGMNLKYIKEQTQEICLVAIANNPESEKYVTIKLDVNLDYLLNAIDNLGEVNLGVYFTRFSSELSLF